MKSKIYSLGVMILIGTIILVAWYSLKKEISLDEIITQTDFRFYSDEIYKNDLGFPLVKFQDGQVRYGPGYSCKYSLAMPYASGDLDNDGDKDYAILIFNWNGGTGQFLYLTTVLNVNGRPMQSSIVDLGDRISVKKMEISNAEIMVDVIDLRYKTEWQGKYKLIDGFLEPAK